jgi:hypothetical protein
MWKKTGTFGEKHQVLTIIKKCAIKKKRKEKQLQKWLIRVWTISIKEDNQNWAMDFSGAKKSKSDTNNAIGSHHRNGSPDGGAESENVAPGLAGGTK